MSEDKLHIVPFKNHIMVLLTLIVLTILTVAITSIDLGPYNTAAALVIATIKIILVLMYFMHLRFDQVIYRIMAIMVLCIYSAVIIVTFLDYLNR